MNVIDSKKLSMMFFRKGVTTFRHMLWRDHSGAAGGGSSSMIWPPS